MVVVVIAMIVVRFSRKVIENNGGRWCWMLEMELAVVLLLIRKNNIRIKMEATSSFNTYLSKRH